MMELQTVFSFYLAINQNLGHHPIFWALTVL